MVRSVCVCNGSGEPGRCRLELPTPHLVDGWARSQVIAMCRLTHAETSTDWGGSLP